MTAALDWRRERWTTPDDDFIDVDHCGPVQSSTPVLVLFHGLEGSSRSHYARGLVAAANARGWLGVVPHFRSCSGAINLAPRFYHCGDADEIDWILARIAQQYPHRPLFAAGVSLGGNALLRRLGLCAAAPVAAAAAISAPLDLPAAGAALSRGLNRIYTQIFLRTLKRKALAKLDQYPGLFDREALYACRDLYAFDDLVTAPLHGFRSADDYWRRAASKPLLREIAVPTLVLNARNDPLLPAFALPRVDEVSAAVELDFPDHGGHVGFAAASGLRVRYDWMPRRVLDFFAQALPQ